MHSLTKSSEKHAYPELVRRYKDVTLSDSATVRERYGEKPITLLRYLNPSIKFPKKLRIIFACLWKEIEMIETGEKRATRFIIKGPRGGGKSQMLGSIGFAKWYLQSRNIVDMGGSLEQAQGVYNYFAANCFAHDSILSVLPDEPTMKKTTSDKGNYFKAVAASPKQVRGPHPDCLFIDEACETKDELILSALPMVNTSQTPLVVMTSTFHKIFGLFQETWDEADRRGYVRFSWDIIDVTKSFDPNIWKDPTFRKEIPDFSIEQAGEQSLEYRVGGRTGDPEGWVSIDNVIQAWREKDSIDWFDVEYMGSRPSASGLVNNPEDVDACVIPDLKKYQYRNGAVVIGGLDWGFSGMTAFTALMEHTDLVKVQVHNKNYTRVRSGIIIDEIVEVVEQYRIPVIYADSSHPFENENLQAALHKKFGRTDHRCVVIPVITSKENDVLLGNYRAHFQRRLLRIPKAHQEAIWQHKRYKYVEGTDKAEKKNDHIPDATKYNLKHWQLQKSKNELPKVNTDRGVQRDKGISTITGGMMDEIF